MKKFISIIIICLMVFTFLTSCGNKEANKTEDASTNQISNNKSEYNQNDNNNTEDDYNKLKLPDYYPNDLVPLVKDAMIQTVMKFENDIQLMYITDKSKEDLIEFYQNVMDSSEDYGEGMINYQYVIAGYKEDADIQIMIFKESEKDDKSFVVIHIYQEVED